MRHSPTFFVAVLFLFPCAMHVAWGYDKPASKGLDKLPADGKDIERLIKQLGSDEFNEREAASNALSKVGEPALNALLKAAKGSDDLEVRSRAASLVLAIRGAAVKGKWKVEFANGVIEACEIDKEGKASVVEPLRSSTGQVEAKAGSYVIAFADDRVERWTPVGKKFVVEHWFPASQMLIATPFLGIAEPAQ